MKRNVKGINKSEAYANHLAKCIPNDHLTQPDGIFRIGIIRHDPLVVVVAVGV